jgi:hypothetical protein
VIGGGSLKATGMVTFLDGQDVVGQVPLSAFGQAVFTIAHVKAGTHHFAAYYNSDTYCAASLGH